MGSFQKNIKIDVADSEVSSFLFDTFFFLNKTWHVHIHYNLMLAAQSVTQLWLIKPLANFFLTPHPQN